MTGDAVNGRNGCGARAGARTLTMLAAPLNGALLRALQDGPRQQAELRREAGHPAQTTLRAQLKKLYDAGVIEKQRRNRFPGVLEYELSEAGNDLLPVTTVLGSWLERSPEGGLELGGGAVKAAVKALVAAWSNCMLRALAAGPLTLTELSGLIPGSSYPSLERRLAALRVAGLVSAREGDGRGTPYGLNRWGREAVASLVSALRWERRHMPDSPPIARIDVETAFLMGVPLLAPPATELSGSCRMAVDMAVAGNGHGPCGVMVSTGEGRIASCTTRLEGNPDAWASGSDGSWLTAIIDGDLAGLEIGGDGPLARTLIEQLHRSLFGVRTR